MSHPDFPRSALWPAGASRPVATPIQPSVVYAAADPDALDDQYEGRAEGWTYAREGHPNAAVLGARIDALEALPAGARPGVVTGSGMAAIAACVFAACRAGDHVLGAVHLYGRTRRLLAEDLPRLGIESSLADPADAATFAAALRANTRLALIEVVSNPALRVADLDGIARACRERGVLLVVDNTFTTPATCRPFEHGADLVVHSVTKLLAGHSDATLGWAAARDPALGERVVTLAVTMGMTPSPFDCWLAERGLATFALRQARAQDTAARLADRLAGAPGVARVLYPGRRDHPDHARTATLLGGPGNMLALELAGGRAAANVFARALGDRLPFAPTLGDVGTTVSHPASSSHRALPPAEREAMGIREGFFRLSVGLEPPGALAEAIAGAASAAAGP